MRDELDNDLQRLFEENSPELPEEPFRAEMLRRIEKTRTGYNRVYWLLTTLILAVCATLANFVIDGVMLLCDELTRVLQIGGELLTTPAGLAVASAVALLSLALRRRVLSMFV